MVIQSPKYEMLFINWNRSLRMLHPCSSYHIPLLGIIESWRHVIISGKGILFFPLGKPISYYNLQHSPNYIVQPPGKIIVGSIVFWWIHKINMFPWGGSPFSRCYWEIQGIPGQFSHIPVLCLELHNQHIQKLNTSFQDFSSLAIHI